MTARALVISLIATVSVIGCAAGQSATSQSGSVAEASDRSGCFYWRQVTDFDPLDRSNLIVYAPGKASAYRVSISPPSRSLPSANHIAFSSRSNRICGHAGERLLIGSSTELGFSVTQVYPLSKTDLQALLGEGEEIAINPDDPDQALPGTGAEIERVLD
jgi:hypothetical protein